MTVASLTTGAMSLFPARVGLLPASVAGSRACFCWIVVLLSVLQVVHASWWYLGVASSYQIISDEVRQKPRHACSGLNFLKPNQRKLCNNDVKLLDVIRKGASMGIHECQHQFSDRRWNCSTVNDTSVFGKILRVKSRETAYIYAISSAGIMYSVTRACAKGELETCGCDKKVKNRQPGNDFTWGGCSDNIRHGARFSKDFLDRNEVKQVEDGSMNIWNNGAGRKTIKEEMAVRCKCHGVSGDCSVKICWKKMESFRSIGEALKRKFDGASFMMWDKGKKKLKRLSGNHKRPTKKDLVYLSESPNFCETNEKFGILGTRGRECNKTSYGLDGCTLMCCGRGYTTLVNKQEMNCDCKFHWCCTVVCKKCTKRIETHYCN